MNKKLAKKVAAWSLADMSNAELRAKLESVCKEAPLYAQIVAEIRHRDAAAGCAEFVAELDAKATQS